MPGIFAGGTIDGRYYNTQDAYVRAAAEFAAKQDRARQEAQNTAERNAALSGARTAADTNSVFKTDRSGNTQYQSGSAGGAVRSASDPGASLAAAAADKAAADADLARQKELLTFQAKLQTDAEARRLALLPQFTKSMSPEVPGVDTSLGAENELYARAKDRSGMQGRAASDAFQSMMGARGISPDSPMAMGGQADIIGGARAGLDDWNREYVIGSSKRLGDVADRNYAGAIQQRGQNMSTIPAFQSFITQRALY